MVCAKDYVCSKCGCEYNNGPGYPSAFRVGKTYKERMDIERKRYDMYLRSLGIPQEEIDYMNNEIVRCSN